MASISDELLMQHKDSIKNILEESAKYIAIIFAGQLNTPSYEENIETINHDIQIKLHRLLGKMMKEDENVKQMIFKLARNMK